MTRFQEEEVGPEALDFSDLKKKKKKKEIPVDLVCSIVSTRVSWLIVALGRSSCCWR